MLWALQEQIPTANSSENVVSMDAFRARRAVAGRKATRSATRKVA